MSSPRRSSPAIGPYRFDSPESFSHFFVPSKRGIPLSETEQGATVGQQAIAFLAMTRHGLESHLDQLRQAGARLRTPVFDGSALKGAFVRDRMLACSKDQADARLVDRPKLPGRRA